MSRMLSPTAGDVSLHPHHLHHCLCTFGYPKSRGARPVINEKESVANK